PHAGEIHRFPDVALRRCAVAEETYGDARLLAQPKRIGDASGMRRLRSDRDTEGKIVRRTGEAIAALVAAPVEQDLLELDAAPEQRRVVAIGGQQYILLTHRARDADRHRFLAKRDRVGAEPSGTLQRYGFQIKGAGEHHAAI